jgi:putative RNA 2'-phosphotransferase
LSAHSAQRLTRLSRVVALVLRHKPGKVGVQLDPAGFVLLDDLARALAAQPGWDSITTDDLIALARSDPRRYEIRDERIRARYGHTVAVEAPGDLAFPPEWLYVAVAPAEIARIATDGLQPTDRQHVHLATTPQAALDVGRRHAQDAQVVVIFARRAATAGTAFRRAGPALYLVAAVAAKFLLLPDGAAEPR